MKVKFVLGALLMVGLGSLGMAGCTGTPEGGEAITLTFRAMVGDKPFACGQTYEGLGSSKVQFLPHDFRMYVHNLRLVDDAGKEVAITLKADGTWQTKDVALLDFEDNTGECKYGTKETRHIVEGTVPKGSYKGLRFSLGLPFSLNHQDAFAAQAPLNISAMFWGWQQGYKFFRLDGILPSVSETYRFHIGSMKCESDPSDVNKVKQCGLPNLAEIQLADFAPSTHAVVIDVAKILEKTAIDQNQKDSPFGCMSSDQDVDCKEVYNSVGLVFEQATGNPSTQTAFSVVSAK